MGARLGADGAVPFTQVIHPRKGSVMLAVVISIATLNLYLAPFVPIVTAAVTKVRAPGWVKTAVTVGVAAVVSLVVTAVEQDVDLVLTWDSLGRIAMTVGTAVTSYLVFRNLVVDPIAAKLGPTKGLG